jgi:hypothetical protein
MQINDLQQALTTALIDCEFWSRQGQPERMPLALAAELIAAIYSTPHSVIIKASRSNENPS